MSTNSSVKEYYPLISVCIPAYNSGKYIKEAIQSVINQVYSNWELIIVNDGSSDETEEIAKSFLHDKRVIYIKQENRGASVARNKAMKVAKGDYIQFLDADDIISPNKFIEQLNDLKNSNDILSICKTAYFYDNSTCNAAFHSKYDEKFYISTKDVFDFLVRLYGGYNNEGCMITIHSWLVPMSVIKKAGDWREHLTVDDDGEFFCRVVLNSNGIIYNDKATNYYRKHTTKQSLSGSLKLENARSIFDSTMYKYEHMRKINHSEKLDKVFARHFREVSFIVYPMYKAIHKEAEAMVHKLGGTDYIPILGGSTQELVKKIIGWKNTKKLVRLIKIVCEKMLKTMIILK